VVGESQVIDGDRSGTFAWSAAEVALGSAPGAAGLLGAVLRLRSELAAHRTPLPDRAVAEDELDALGRQAVSSSAPDTESLRHSLLLVASALGSVSALSAALTELRAAVEEMALPR
jgi:hypothetical protein